jgi:hypothetical protein
MMYDILQINKTRQNLFFKEIKFFNHSIKENQTISLFNMFTSQCHIINTCENF